MCGLRTGRSRSRNHIGSVCQLPHKNLRRNSRVDVVPGHAARASGSQRGTFARPIAGDQATPLAAIALVRSPHTARMHELSGDKTV